MNSKEELFKKIYNELFEYGVLNEDNLNFSDYDEQEKEFIRILNKYFEEYFIVESFKILD